jgi:hypothetical protein
MLQRGGGDVPELAVAGGKLRVHLLNLAAPRPAGSGESADVLARVVAAVFAAPVGEPAVGLAGPAIYLVIFFSLFVVYLLDAARRPRLRFGLAIGSATAASLCFSSGPLSWPIG